jgi:hypothetical protein
MTGLSSSPKLHKGALVLLDPQNPVSTAIIFQYNPEFVTRRLQSQGVGEGAGDNSEFNRVRGAPIETLDLEVEIDATDQLASGDAIAEQVGIYPQLAQLELLLYPKVSQIIMNNAQLSAGSIEIIPPEGPVLLLVWGLKRVVPVRLNGLSIREEQHDPSLNPIRARVGLNLRALSYNDLPAGSAAYNTFIAHQVVKEGLATMRGIVGAAGILSGATPLF